MVYTPDGVLRGAPQARQVADRFHLALNLSEAVEKELARHRSFLSIPKPVGTSAAPFEDGASSSEVVINRQRIVQGRRVAKQSQFEMVRALHDSGRTVSSIVRATELGRKQVTAWVGLVELPERNRMEPTPRTPAFYQDHLAKRWAEGCQHGQILMRKYKDLNTQDAFLIWPNFSHHGGKL